MFQEVKKRHVIEDDEDDEKDEDEEVGGLNRRLLFWGVCHVCDPQQQASIALPWALTEPSVVELLKEIGENLKWILEVLEVMAYHQAEEQWAGNDGRTETGNQ
ncbi:hypothetical protein BU17DRAFT_91266 [Hysterangium stoloniferum]|nr:hypothetical protein BU17DRAFT_91266 [Hysterangium stoloniferum]